MADHHVWRGFGPAVLDTLSIGLVRTCCKCNDVNFFTRYDLDIQDDGDSVIIAGSSEFYPMFLPKGVRTNCVKACGHEPETIRQTAKDYRGGVCVRRAGMNWKTQA